MSFAFKIFGKPLIQTFSEYIYWILQAHYFMSYSNLLRLDFFFLKNDFPMQKYSFQDKYYLNFSIFLDNCVYTGFCKGF